MLFRSGKRFCLSVLYSHPTKECVHFLSGKNVIITPVMPITEKIKAHLKLKSKKATLPYPNISRILTKINAIPCSCLFIQSHSFVKFKFVDFILLQNYEQFNHRKRGINHVLHPRADRPRQPSRPCFFPAITGRAAYPRRE